MTTAAHLWAVGFDAVGRANQVRDELNELRDKQDLILLDTAVAVRYPDGSITLDGEPLVVASQPPSRSFAGFLASLALAPPPLTGAAVGNLLRSAHAATSAAVGIGDDFVCEVERQIKSCTSALFVLDREGNMDAVLQGIRGLGGKVLKTTVDLERAMLIQSTLADVVGDAKIGPPPRRSPDGKKENAP
jgi:uncharacterized membrane protein